MLQDPTGILDTIFSPTAGSLPFIALGVFAVATSAYLIFYCVRKPSPVTHTPLRSVVPDHTPLLDSVLPSKMSVIGLDLGNYKSTIAVARNRGIDIVVNDVSNRFTPTMVGFSGGKRSLGEAAKTEEIMNYQNIVTSLKTLIGRHPNEAEIAEVEAAFLKYKLAAVGTEVGAEVNYQDSTQVFSMTQLVGMYLSQIKLISENSLSSNVSDIVISTPAYYTNNQRQALLCASQIAGLNCVRLLNESTAAALLYGLTKKQEFPENEARHVMFVDVGHTCMTVSIVSFTQQEAVVKATTFDRQVCGRAIDALLVKHTAEFIKEKYKVDVTSRPKAMLRIEVGCERLKKMLSANVRCPLSIENITDEVDVRSEMTREEFEQIISHLMEKVESVMRQAVFSSGIKKEDIHSVELMGGSTRIPLLKQHIQNFFQREILSTTLNADEAVARGCAFRCAMISPLYKVREYNVKDVTAFDIQLTVSNPDGEAQTVDLFAANSAIPATKALTVNRSNDFQVEVTYKNASALPKGADLVLGSFKVSHSKPGESVPVKLKLRLNPHGILEFNSAALLEPVADTAEPMATDKPAEEAAAPAATAPAAADGAEPMATDKKKEKVKKTEIPFAQTSFVLGEKDLAQLREQELAMMNADKLIADTLLSKNSLEEYVYDLRNKLETTHAEFMLEATKESFLASLSETEDWLYGDGENTTKSVYIERLAALKKIGEPCKDRYYESEERPNAFASLSNVLKQTQELCNTTDEKYSHIEKEDRNKVLAECSKRQAWMDDAVARQSKVAKHEDNYVKSKDIVAQRETLIAFSNNIFNKPKPKPKQEPPKETPKETPKPEAGQETPMQTDATPDATPDVPADAKPTEPPMNMDVD